MTRSVARGSAAPAIGGTVVEVEHVGRARPELAGADVRRVHRQCYRRAPWIDVDARNVADREARIVQQHGRQHAEPAAENGDVGMAGPRGFEERLGEPHLARDLVLVEGSAQVVRAMPADRGEDVALERAARIDRKAFDDVAVEFVGSRRHFSSSLRPGIATVQHNSRMPALCIPTFPPVGRCRILLPKWRSAPPAEAPLVDVFQEAEMLRKVPFFGGLDPAKLKLLAFTSRAVKFGPGELLMTRGDPPDSVYVIIEGEVEIVGETPTGEFIVAVVGRNELQGEMGVIQNTPRGATVRARTAVRALRIAADVFLRLLTENPGCALHVMRELSARVVAGNTRVATALRDVETLKAQLRANTNVVGDRAPS